MATAAHVDVDDLTRRVQEVYRSVAEHPEGHYHFELGCELAQRLGYPTDLLDRIPADAIASFAGVGYFFDLAAPTAGERVLDLGSGSGTDVFAAATLVGPRGHVIGLDMTDAQLAKAERLRATADITGVEFRKGRIEAPPLPDGTVDLVISNGVINLSADKAAVFASAARVLVPGGRLALADIVTERPLTEQIVCDAELWAACIGGAAQIDDYRAAIEAVGLQIQVLRTNPQYRFLSGSARTATTTYGVTSIGLLAVKPV
jgi:SAM-dependent methyltransferase